MSSRHTPGSAQPEPTQDIELRAMLAILKYLEPLDRDARRRVLAWANDRLVELKFAEPMEQDAVRKFTEALGEAARRMGGVTPLDIIRASEAITTLREDAVAAGTFVPGGDDDH